MAGRVEAGTLKAWLADGGEIALLDVREHGQYGEGHPFLAVPLPYSRFELGLAALVPNQAVRLVLCDGGDGVAERAAERAEALGFSNISVLAGGVEGWRAAGFTLYAGVNVPSKALGELIEHTRHTPHVTAEALKAMQDAGENLTILDGRTFTEFQRMSIPGAVSCPNGELALRIAGLVPDPNTKIVVNCAGRTRSIVGAQTLIDIGVPNPVYALENGTQGWFLAGHRLDHGASRSYREGLPPSSTDLTTLQARARALAGARGAQFVSAEQVAAWRADPFRTTYLLDVRTLEEAEDRPVPGFVHTPGGQLVQATDQWIGVRGARIILLDHEQVRAPITAQWLRQQGHEAYVLEGGLTAAAALTPPPVIPEAEPQARLSGTSRNRAEPHLTRSRLGSMLAVGSPGFNPGSGRDDGSLPPLAPGELAEALGDGSFRLIDLRPSMSYRKEHIDGAAWSIRPRIAAAVADAVSDPGQTVVLVADAPGVAALAAIDLAEAGVSDIRLLAGGHAAARAAGLPMVATPDAPGDADCIDFLFFTHDRHDGNAVAARQYLAWELGLIDQLDAQERSVFSVGGRVSAVGRR